MLHSLLRSPKCRQIGQIELNLSVVVTAGVPAIAGPDAAFVESITDNGVGDYTITLKEASKMNLHIGAIVLLTADSSAIAMATASPKLSFKILGKSVAAAPAAKDIDFNVRVLFMDQLSNYF